MATETARAMKLHSKGRLEFHLVELLLTRCSIFI